MTHMHQPGSRRLMSDINVVPFIDVMLVLLVIFMITAPLLTQGVQVNLPKTTARVLTDQNNAPLIVTVDRMGNYYINAVAQPKISVTEQSLTQRIQSALSMNPDRKVFVRGDSEVSYGKVVQVMALLQKTGVPNVGLVTEPLKST